MIQNPERFNIHISCEHFICWPVHDAFSISFSWFISFTCKSGCFYSLGRKLFIQPSPWMRHCTNTTLQQPNLTARRRLCYFGSFSISYTLYWTKIYEKFFTLCNYFLFSLRGYKHVLKLNIRVLYVTIKHFLSFL